MRGVSPQLAAGGWTNQGWARMMSPGWLVSSPTRTEIPPFSWSRSMNLTPRSTASPSDVNAQSLGSLARNAFRAFLNLTHHAGHSRQAEHLEEARCRLRKHDGVSSAPITALDCHRASGDLVRHVLTIRSNAADDIV